MVLITGATGFLGSCIARMLIRDGHRVRALKRKNSSLSLTGETTGAIEWVEGEVNDVVALEEAMTGVTRVCHCAAMVSFHPRDAQTMYHINVEGTANVVNAALAAGVERFIHVSSIAALGRDKKRTHLDEKSTWVESSGNTRYAVSKYRSEQEAWRGHAEGLPVAIVNPAVIIGSGFWNGGSARFFDQIYKGLKFCPVGHSGFVDVRDVAAFTCQLLQSDITGERYVLSAENLSYRAFFEQIAQALGVPPPSIPVQPWLAEVAWRVEWLKEKLLGVEPVVTKESARSSVSSYTYGNEKSLTLPGFQYRPLAQTIQDTALQYLIARQEKADFSILPL
jgi:nucleoside-diphosphate-sugar epimerase